MLHKTNSTKGRLFRYSTPPKLWRPCHDRSMLSFLFRSCGVLGWDLHNDEQRLVLSIAVERIPESDENGENDGNQQNEQKPEEETRQTVFV